jgi:CDP-glucose 4,6-dehydratase
MKEQPEKYSGAWNFGPDYSNCVDVRLLTEKIVRAWGSGTWDQTPRTPGPHEANFLKLDIAKSVTKLGWRPVYNIDEAIRKTVEWYRIDYARAEDIYKFSLGQIESYLNDADKNV